MSVIVSFYCFGKQQESTVGSRLPRDPKADLIAYTVLNVLLKFMFVSVPWQLSEKEILFSSPYLACCCQFFG